MHLCTVSLTPHFPISLPGPNQSNSKAHTPVLYARGLTSPPRGKDSGRHRSGAASQHGAASTAFLSPPGTGDGTVSLPTGPSPRPHPPCPGWAGSHNPPAFGPACAPRSRLGRSPARPAPRAGALPRGAQEELAGEASRRANQLDAARSRRKWSRRADRRGRGPGSPPQAPPRTCACPGSGYAAWRRAPASFPVGGRRGVRARRPGAGPGRHHERPGLHRHQRGGPGARVGRGSARAGPPRDAGRRGRGRPGRGPARVSARRLGASRRGRDLETAPACSGQGRPQVCSRRPGWPRRYLRAPRRKSGRISSPAAALCGHWSPCLRSSPGRQRHGRCDPLPVVETP